MSLTGPMTARRSNAKTAYGLMSDIKAYILEEPKRVWMDAWLIKGKRRISSQFGVDAPICGTVGCIAGNAVMLAGLPSSASTAWEKASRLLSGGNEDLDVELDGLFLNTDIDALYGTEEYARIVAENISDFQSEHEAALRAVRIEAPGPKGSGR